MLAEPDLVEALLIGGADHAEILEQQRGVAPLKVVNGVHEHAEAHNVPSALLSCGCDLLVGPEGYNTGRRSADADQHNRAWYGLRPGADQFGRERPQMRTRPHLGDLRHPSSPGGSWPAYFTS